jgi:histidyl-tRNA synthetase
MKYASKCGFKFVIIADKGEYENNSCILKDMESGNQEIVKLDKLAANIRDKPGKNNKII